MGNGLYGHRIVSYLSEYAHSLISLDRRVRLLASARKAQLPALRLIREYQTFRHYRRATLRIIRGIEKERPARRTFAHIQDDSTLFFEAALSSLNSNPGASSKLGGRYAYFLLLSSDGIPAQPDPDTSRYEKRRGYFHDYAHRFRIPFSSCTADER